jgi:hypothetical protein
LAKVAIKRGDFLLKNNCAKRYFLMALILMFILLLSTTGSAQTIEVSDIELNVQNLTLLWGEEEVITATLKPFDATDKRIWWENSNEAVLVLRTSDNKAYIRALGPGSSVIAAISVDGRYVSRCTVTVIKLVTSIGIGEDLIQLVPGDSYKIKAWVEPRDASEQGIIWESSNNAVASVNSDGLIKSVSEGETRIIARSLENLDINTYVTVKVTSEPLIAVSEEGKQAEDISSFDNNLTYNDLDSSEDEPNYLLYTSIGILIFTILLILILVFQRRLKQKSGEWLQNSSIAGRVGSQPTLRGITGLYGGKRFNLNAGSLVIGRDNSLAQIVYPQEYDQISRRHLTISFDSAAKAFIAEDTSSNGTFLNNGDKLPMKQKIALKPGETITLAQTEEVFIVELE